VRGKPVDLELTSDRAVQPASARYSFLRVLAHLRGRPVGQFDVGNDEALAPAALRAHAVRDLEQSTWRALLVDDLAGSAPGGVEDAERMSVVVCTRNRAELLEGCLAALERQTHPAYDVVVVDNAPDSDSAREVCARFDGRHVVEPRPGLDWARNRGLAAVDAPLVAYIDDDARPDREWLVRLAAAFDAPDVTAATGLVAPDELETGAQLLFEDGNWGMGKGFEPRPFTRRGWKRMTYTPHECGVGCNMAFRTEALERLGGFDPALDVGTPTGGGGDLDVFQRILESSGVIAYRPDAVVRHKHRRTWAALKRQLYDNGRAYSSTLWAALLRARGRNRLGVVAAYWRWIWRHHARRIGRRLLRRDESLPLSFLFAELRGAPLGPILYTRSRRRARQLT